MREKERGGEGQVEGERGGEGERGRGSGRGRVGERERERERGGVIKGGASRQSPDVEPVHNNYKFIYILILPFSTRIAVCILVHRTLVSTIYLCPQHTHLNERSK